MPVSSKKFGGGMHAVDTNLVVRLFVHDDAAQVAAARAALASDAVFIPKSVILEFEWVMRGVYGEAREPIATAIETILKTANVHVEDAFNVARALEWFRNGMDFADALHVASSSHVEAFLSFDAALRRRVSKLRIKPPVVVPS